jgi:DNA-binding NtrC family response regulator
MPTTVLIVDDEPSARNFCAEVLEEMGLLTRTAGDARLAASILEAQAIDVVLSDVHMPGATGIELLRTIRTRFPETDVVVMTGYGTIPEAVEAVKLGAYDYISKPLKPDDLRRIFRRLVEKRALAAENRLLREQVRTQQGFGQLIGNSPSMRAVYELVIKVAERRHPVLILGESGTGKELVARAIHTYGPSRDKPFVPIDCGALSASLIESELFGHVRGAFTGATQARPGLLAEAKGGTVFLDEIGELPIELQSKLLRALQEREIRPLGSNERRPLEARVIAATNLDLEEAIGKGTFRKDLYFRLNVVSIHMPPLRERKSDIPALVHFFLERHATQEGITGIAPEAMTCLMAYDWPGNVRELENCIQRAVALGSPPLIQVKDLPSSLVERASAREEDAEPRTLEDLERRAILRALEASGGDRLRAAKLLGIGKTTIYRKLKEYGLDAPGPTVSAPR